MKQKEFPKKKECSRNWKSQVDKQTTSTPNKVSKKVFCDFDLMFTTPK